MTSNMLKWLLIAAAGALLLFAGSGIVNLLQGLARVFIQ